MKKIKIIEKLLIGNFFITLAIIIHLAYTELLLTDFIALIGVGIFISIYFREDKTDVQDETLNDEENFEKRKTQ